MNVETVILVKCLNVENSFYFVVVENCNFNRAIQID